MTNLEALSHTESQKYKVYIAIFELLPRCKTMDDLERKLAEQKITVQYKLNRKTEEREGISFKTGDISFKGSQVDRKFSYAGLENRLSINRSQAVKQQENQRQVQQLSPQELYMQYQQNRRVAHRDQANKVTHDAQPNHGKHTDNLLETLLKPLPQEENIPYQFIKRKKEEEKKKRSRGLSR